MTICNSSLGRERSAIIDRPYLKIMNEEQVLLDKTKTNLKLDLKMTGFRNDMEKYATLDI